MRARAALIILILLQIPGVVTAQTPTPTPGAQAEVIQVTASDGLTLVGYYFVQPTAAVGNPAVLLLHQIGVDARAWVPLIPRLVDGGYAVLAVDQRGWGRTGGGQNWSLAADDTTRWLTWLLERPGVQDGPVAIIGASIGANLAMITCAANANCYTAIALSPGLDYHGVTPERALVEGLADRSALLVAAHGDTYSARTVTYLAGQTTQGEVGLRLFPGNLHGNAMFSGPYGNRLISLINDWLHDFWPR